MHTGDALSRLRLLQLTSPALPVGAFSYSQGLEWAVESGLVSSVSSLEDWLLGLMLDGLAWLDVPVLCRLLDACAEESPARLRYWGAYLLAARETSELRAEERNRGRALATLLVDLGIGQAAAWRSELGQCQAAGYALAATRWHIARRDAALGYAWGWLEGQVAAAVKLVPLGQTDGQKVQLRLAEALPEIVGRGMRVEDAAIGACAPAQAIASAQHEIQYSRLFRS